MRTPPPHHPALDGIQDGTQDDVRYHGYHHGSSGAGMIAVEDAEGNTIGVVRHVVVDSPTELSWGFVGSGPADTARSVLLAALDEDARCPTCCGTGYVTADNADTIGPGATSTARIACTDCDRATGTFPTGSSRPTTWPTGASSGASPDNRFWPGSPPTVAADSNPLRSEPTAPSMAQPQPLQSPPTLL